MYGHKTVFIPSLWCRFSSEVSCASSVEFFSKKFTSPQNLCPAFSPLTTPLGQAVTMDTRRMGMIM